MKIEEQYGTTHYVWENSSRSYRSNIGYSMQITKEMRAFADSHGGFFRDFFKILKNEKATHCKVLIYTSHYVQITTIIEITNGDNRVDYIGTFNKYFTESVLKDYLPSLLKLTSYYKEIIPSQYLSEKNQKDLPAYHAPKVENSTGVMYKGKELCFSTKENQKTLTLQVNSSLIHSFFKNEDISNELKEKINQLNICFFETPDVFSSIASVHLYMNDGCPIKVKDTEYMDIYGHCSSQQELKERITIDILEDIAHKMNYEYDVARNKTNNKEDFKIFLKKRLARLEKLFLSIEEDVQQELAYSEKIKEYRISAHTLQKLINEATKKNPQK